jgi:hypothetical protein
MTQTIYKFGWFPDGATDTPYEPANTWARVTTPKLDRLEIAPRTDQIKLLQLLTKQMPEPFFILYVLVVPRMNAEPGRYQSSPLERGELEAFLLKYQDFLENDGRHNLWIRGEDNSTLIYDRHKVIYLYGQLEQAISILNEQGLKEAANICLPEPHSHHYNENFDGSQDGILQEFEWTHSPLRNGDENPE